MQSKQQKQAPQIQNPPRMGRGGPKGQMYAKAKDFKGTLKKLTKYIKPYRIHFIFSALFAVIAAILTVFGPILLGTITTEAYNAFKESRSLGDIVFLGISFKVSQMALLIVMVHVLSASLNYFQGYLLIGLTQNLTYGMRKDLAAKINVLPLKFFDKHAFGDVLSRITNDVETINTTLTQSLSEIFRGLTLVIGFLIAMFLLSPILAGVVVVTTILSLIVARQFIKLSQGYFRSQAKSLGQLNGHIEENYSGHSVVKVFNQQEAAYMQFQDINQDMYDSALKSQFISGIMMPVQLFIGNLAYIAITVVGAFLVTTSIVAIRIDFGIIQTFLQFTRQINQPIQTVSNVANVFQQTAAAAERIFELLDADEESKERDHLVTLNEVKGKVDFDHVHFGYDEDVPVINGFTASIKPGQTVAIVGPTGAGKTTIVNLLMRFYEINSGSITIDDVDIRDMKRSDVRNLFGMVLQDTWLFEGTILENISYGSNDKSFDDIQRAAKSSQVEHFIESLSGGYQFVLNEGGTNISQGQRQLITICRAMLTNRPMLILDEATSSVDTRTEILIQKAMDNLMKDRTSFVIAHRLSTIRDADIIFVMKEGNIVETGNHESLLKQNGFYASLYYSQFEE